MRLIITGQAAFGAQVMERFHQNGEEVVGVFAPKGKRGEPLKITADKLNIPIFQVIHMKIPEIYSICSDLNSDLNVMAFVTDIVPTEVLDCPRLGTIQYHPSLLPKHRGGSAINWAIINGETKTGITIFWPDGGIDTGPILLRKEVDIASDDTVGSIYFNKLFTLGVESLLEAVDLIKKGDAPRIRQDESLATSEPLCTEATVKIDWSQPAQVIYNLIRGANPQPGAYTYIQDEKIKIFDSELSADSANGEPGQVLEISSVGMKIKTADKVILVKRIQGENTPKMRPAEYDRLININFNAVIIAL